VVPYDYLLICTGSTYRSGIKTNNPSLNFRWRQVRAHADQRQGCMSGGGFLPSGGLDGTVVRPLQRGMQRVICNAAVAGSSTPHGPFDGVLPQSAQRVPRLLLFIKSSPHN
jgi:hypothetical protein